MHFRELFVVFLLHFIRSNALELSCKQIHEFVDGHNSRRLLLAKGAVPNQPPASEMKFMIWDEEVAAKAKKWAAYQAANNKFSHNPDRDIGSKRFTTGENIFMIYSTDSNLQLNIDSALSSWFNEYKDYKYGPLKPSDFDGGRPAVGHYTQMAWSDSVYVGCGVAKVKHGDKTMYFVVCNYGPSGNYLGQTPYKTNGKGSNQLTCAIRDCKRPYGTKC